MKSILFFLCVSIFLITGCSTTTSVHSLSGATAVSAGQIQLGPDGLSAEQRNIRDRIQQDNKPGAIKHLYIISAYSGQCILYSTVRGKVTSSGKRLLPDDLQLANSVSEAVTNIIENEGQTYTTHTLPGEDGTYGHSMEYLYWWDSRGVYHQHYVQGGQIVHISSEPIQVKGVIINLESK